MKMNYRLFNRIEDVTIKDEQAVKQDIYNLWQECFGDSDSYVNFYFDWKIGDNQVFLIYAEHESPEHESSEHESSEYDLAAMLNLNPYTLMVKGEEVHANYIVGVATKKSHRRQGLMAKILEASMEQMYQEEMPFTYLMPAKEGIYLPFDFRIVYEQYFWNDKLIDVRARAKEEQAENKQVEEQKEKIGTGEGLRVAELDQVRVASIDIGNDIEISVLDPHDTNTINELVLYTNEFLLKEYDVFVKRTPYYYERLVSEMRSSDGEILLCYEKNALIGYIAYTAEEIIYVTELVAKQEDEQKVLEDSWKYLKSVTDLDVFKRKPSSQIIAIMGRIINVKTFARMLTSKKPISLIFNVTDPIIKQNDGKFLVNINENGTSIEESQEASDISIDIGELTRLFFGKLSDEELDKLVSENTKNSGSPEKAQTIKEKLKEINSFDSVFINDVV